MYASNADNYQFTCSRTIEVLKVKFMHRVLPDEDLNADVLAVS